MAEGHLVSTKTEYDLEEITLPNPNTKPHKEWNYVERRAYILQVMKNVGHPDFINSSKLADMFGVSPSMLTKDKKAIISYLGENPGKNARANATAFYNHIIRKCLEEDDPKTALQAMRDWNQYLFDIGAEQKAPDKQMIVSAHADLSVPLSERHRSEILSYLEEGQ